MPGSDLVSSKNAEGGRFEVAKGSGSAALVLPHLSKLREKNSLIDQLNGGEMSVTGPKVKNGIKHNTTENMNAQLDRIKDCPGQ